MRNITCLLLNKYTFFTNKYTNKEVKVSAVNIKNDDEEIMSLCCEYIRY